MYFARLPLSYRISPALAPSITLLFKTLAWMGMTLNISNGFLKRWALAPQGHHWVLLSLSISINVYLFIYYSTFIYYLTYLLYTDAYPNNPFIAVGRRPRGLQSFQSQASHIGLHKVCAFETSRHRQPWQWLKALSLGYWIKTLFLKNSLLRCISLDQ